jgi:deoxyribodipyrimidine photo-lyase
MTVAIFLFHRDLRLVDHNGLEFAIEKYDKILPVFIFTPEQVTIKNVLRSTASIEFMINSLSELETEIKKQGGKLYLAYGDNIDMLKKIISDSESNVKAIIETTDYTPYALRRTSAISELCKKKGLEYHSVADSYLLEPGTIKTGSGKTFQKFTPFYEKAIRKTISDPRGPSKFSFYKLISSSGAKGTKKVRRPSWEISLEEVRQNFVPKPLPELAVKGGREEGLELIRKIPEDYAKTHNIPAISTSMLSAHNHFGTVSIREVWAGAKGNKEFIRQLWWRDFYGNIMADFENLYGVGAYEFQKSEWQAPLSDEKKKWLEQWKRGETGVPLVDAGMRQMLRTGWMHNRVRLVVASWLTKDKKIHWRHGERFFAQHLVDYDATQNMMNWIWVASELPFASAPFRKVSAQGTADKFDADGEYVKRWLGPGELDN